MGLIKKDVQVSFLNNMRKAWLNRIPSSDVDCGVIDALKLAIFSRPTPNSKKAKIADILNYVFPAGKSPHIWGKIYPQELFCGHIFGYK